MIGGLSALSWLLTGDPGRRLDDAVGHSGLHVAVAETISAVGEPIASALIAAVVIVAIRQIDAGEDPSFRRAYSGMLRRFRRVVGAQLLATLAVLLMAITFVGLPFAAWKYIGWLFIQQQILFEDASPREAFRSSAELVRGRWWYTLRLAAVFWLILVVTGPLLGFALIFTYMSLTLINTIGAIVFALLIPYVAIGQTLIYFDLQARAARRRPALAGAPPAPPRRPERQSFLRARAGRLGP